MTNNNKINIIIAGVCSHFKTNILALKLHSRKNPLPLARQTAFYFIRKHTDLSLSEIGRILNKNHTSVIYANKVINNILSLNLKSEANLINFIFELEHKLQINVINYNKKKKRWMINQNALIK